MNRTSTILATRCENLMAVAGRMAAFVAATGALLLALPAAAQVCEITTTVDGRRTPPIGSVASVTQFDADGFNNPEPNLMVFGGTFDAAGTLTGLGGIAGWNGTDVVAIGDRTQAHYPTGNISFVFQYDPDASGPQQPQLHAIRNNSNGTFTMYSWARLGSGWFSFNVPGRVNAVTTWDPDGPNGLAPFCVLGGVDIDNRADVVRFNGGLTFSSIASGTQNPGAGPNVVAALTTWDHDANVNTREFLIVGGEFARLNSTNCSNVGRLEYNSTTGQVAINTLGGGVSGSLQPRVTELTTWQLGTGPRSLVIGGSFTSAGGLGITNLALWNGSTYLAFGGSPIISLQALTNWDPDGALPGAERLVIATPSAVQRYDPGLVRFVDIGDAISPYIGSVFTLGVWDVVGTGAQPEFLFAGGFRGSAPPGEGDEGVVRINDTSKWLTCPQAAPTGPVHAAVFQPGGFVAGPPNRFLVGGQFDQIGPARVSNIAQWNGTAWRGVAAGFNAPVRTLLSARLTSNQFASNAAVVGGEFTASGTTSLNRIARLETDLFGTDTWVPLGSGLNGTVHTMTTFDPDGTGPLPLQLIVGGDFTTAGGVTANRIAAWNQSTSTWSAMSSGMNGSVRAVFAWDPDGTGPGLPQLIAGGSFTTASGFPIANLAQWDGVQWRPFDGGQPNGAVLALGQRNRGALRPQELLIGGSFSQIGTRPLSNIASWDGTRFDTTFHGVNGIVNVITSSEIDQDPFLNLQNEVVIGGSFTQSDNGNPGSPTFISRVAYFSEISPSAGWRTLSSGASMGSVSTVIPFTAAPGGRPRLLIGGNFATGTDRAHVYVHQGTRPFILAQPGPSFAEPCDGETVTYTVNADGMDLAYRWMRGDEPLFPGETAAGSVISGVDTPTLRIENVSPADSGAYRCEVANVCKVLSTRFVQFQVNLCGCPADFNGDDVVDADDLGDYINCYFQELGNAGFCPRADINADTFVDADDLGDFINAYFAGCP
ncbi:MAG: hypothetical protein AB7K52_00850 [Phycisphaerales bacterium]